MFGRIRKNLKKLESRGCARIDDLGPSKAITRSSVLHAGLSHALTLARIIAAYGPDYLCILLDG